MEVLAYVPIWVWPLLVGLVVIAVISMRERRTPLAVVYGLPLLVVLSLRTVAGFAVGPVVWLGFAAGYALGAAFGWRAQERITLGRSGARVHQRGEGLTALAILVLFGVNFAVGMIGGVAPGLLAGVGVPFGVSLLLGLASGSFGGRALRVAAMGRMVAV